MLLLLLQRTTLSLSFELFSFFSSSSPVFSHHLPTPWFFPVHSSTSSWVSGLEELVDVFCDVHLLTAPYFHLSVGMSLLPGPSSLSLIPWLMCKDVYGFGILSCTLWKENLNNKFAFEVFSCPSFGFLGWQKGPNIPKEATHNEPKFNRNHNMVAQYFLRAKCVSKYHCNLNIIMLQRCPGLHVIFYRFKG